MLLIYKDFEWDIREATASATARGVTFREASTVFADEHVVLSQDPTSAYLRAVGRSSQGRTLVVWHRPGRRTLILGATLRTNGAEVLTPERPAAAPAEPERATATPVEAHAVPKQGPAEPPRPRSATVLRVVATPDAPRKKRPPVPAEKAPDAAPPSERRVREPSWTAETYGVYWDAYSAARDEAKRQGKSAAEAQRIGKEAGDRAAFGSAVQPPPKSSTKSEARPGSWRAAARALKVS